jgi:hypothetical protein
MHGWADATTEMAAVTRSKTSARIGTFYQPLPTITAPGIYPIYRAPDMKVDASSIRLETPLNPSVSCTHRWQALLYYYILVSSRAATILESPAFYY